MTFAVLFVFWLGVIFVFVTWVLIPLAIVVQEVRDNIRRARRRREARQAEETADHLLWLEQMR